LEYLNGDLYLARVSSNRFVYILKTLRSAIARFEYSKFIAIRSLSITIPLIDQMLNIVAVESNRGSAPSILRSSMSTISWSIFYLKITISQFYTYVFPATEIRSEKRQLEKSRKACLPKKPPEDYLISVLIPTYNRANLLVERSIPSVLNQTHKNLELIVVGDHCTDDTEQKIRRINDNRLKFYNLPVQGAYPKMKTWRWQVAGTKPMNVGIGLANGDWIAHLDDDDEFSADHIETLLRLALESDTELVYGIMERETATGEWEVIGSPDFGIGSNLRPAVLYVKYLSFFKWNIHAWKLGEPGDGNIWKRMKLAGVKTAFIPKVIGKCYSSVRSNK
jgi:cellulose synthase/poly-beta-1,6-N-acetylglucosamine synthase-like glycosyltransferase